MTVAPAFALAFDLVVGGLILSGAFFFVAGTVGLLRFPDVYCRLHALTKADNLGLGLICVGLVLRAGGWHARFQVGVTWILALVAAAAVCHLLARSSLREGVPAVNSAPAAGNAVEGEAPSLPEQLP
ncbi:hypothetical protein BH23GEM11_BH23GEM11_02010 [soil metagenome]